MPDLNNIFDRVIKTIESSKNEGAGAKDWWRWPLVIALVLLAVAIKSWVDNRNSRELATLRHQKKVESVKAAQAHSDKQIAVHQDWIALHDKRIKESIESIENIDAKITEVEARLVADKAEIDRIRTWDDIGSEPDGQG